MALLLIIRSWSHSWSIRAFQNKKIVSLGIFDYLIPDFQEKEELSKDQPIIVAGNLAQEKAGYLYKLPVNPAYTSMVLDLMRVKL